MGPWTGARAKPSGASQSPVAPVGAGVGRWASLPGRRAPASVFGRLGAGPCGLVGVGRGSVPRLGSRALAAAWRQGTGPRACLGGERAAGCGGAHALVSGALGVLSFFFLICIPGAPPIWSPHLSAFHFFLFPWLTFALLFTQLFLFFLASLTFLYFPFSSLLTARSQHYPVSSLAERP